MQQQDKFEHSYIHSYKLLNSLRRDPLFNQSLEIPVHNLSIYGTISEPSIYDSYNYVIASASTPRKRNSHFKRTQNKNR